MTTNQPQKPAFNVFHVIERGNGKKAIWTKIGAQFAHQDGKGFNQVLQYAPLTPGNIVVLPYENDQEAGEQPPA